jgi:hypothetical protein
VKDILILAFYFPPQNTSGAARPYRLQRYLPDFGYRAHVVHAGDLSASIGTRLQSRALSYMSRAVFKAGHGIHLDWVPHAMERSRKLIAEHKIRIVLSTSPPTCTHIAAQRLQRQYKLSWVADFRDPTGVRAYRFWPGGLKGPTLEKGWFRQADCITTVTDSIVEDWQQRYPQWASKFHTLWNGFDPEDGFQQAPFQPNKPRIFAHIGDVYGVRHPGKLLECMDRLIAGGRLDPASLRLKCIGPASPASPVWANPSAVRLRSLGCFEIDGELIPRAAAIRATITADMLLVLDIAQAGAPAGHAAPAKLFDYIRSGRPVFALTAPDSTVENILVRSEIPSVVAYLSDSDAQMDEKLMRFLALPSATSRPSEWFFNRFDGRRLTGTLAALLDQLP